MFNKLLSSTWDTIFSTDHILILYADEVRAACAHVVAERLAPTNIMNWFMGLVNRLPHLTKA